MGQFLPVVMSGFAASVLWLQWLSCGMASGNPNPHPPPPTQKSIAEAYVYGYPLVLMAETRDSFLCQPNAAVNTFQHVYRPPDDTFDTIVSPNVDTLYSVAFLDLSDGPVLLKLPPTDGRYQLAALFDAWTNNFAGVSTLDLNGAGASIVIATNEERGPLPNRLRRVVSPTPLVWLLIRTEVLGADDIPAANAVQNAMSLKMFRGKARPTPPPARCSDAPPPDVVASMSGVEFFTRLAALVKEQGVLLPGDEPELQKLAAIGVGPAAQVSVEDLSPVRKAQLQAGAKLGMSTLDFATSSTRPSETGWGPDPNVPLGDYGVEYLLRASVARVGFGANRNEFAVYQSADSDSRRSPLTGSNTYTLTFPPGEQPPVEAFWSLTVYNSDLYLTANELSRFALGSNDPLEADTDGSVTLTLSHEPPVDTPMANWLPVPSEPFQLTLRMYGPKEEIFTGEWTPPLPVLQVAGDA